MAKSPQTRIEINLEEIYQILDSARQQPMSEAHYEKVKTAVAALAERAVPRWRTTEKTDAVLPDQNPDKPAGKEPAAKGKSAKPGHGRNPGSAFTGAHRVSVAHTTLQSGDTCPECQKGKVYRQKNPKTLIRITGRPPLEATAYELEQLRCNGCGQVFTAEAPAEAGEKKYADSAAAMIAQLRYGSGVPFQRLERLEANLGIPLPAATQWEVVEEKAELLRPALEELTRQAAQGELVHNDDTSMRILKLAREPAPEGKAERTGVFTSGIVSRVGAWFIALFFSGWRHAGENLAEVLKRRAPGLPPLIQMCDALSRNAPKLSEGVKLLLAYCLAHGRRQFVDVAANFPEQCRYVLETLGGVWHNDELAREQKLTSEERLAFHQEHSGPLMKTLREWMEVQLAEHQVEPNSGLGKAIQYMLRHWMPLTLFLREAGAPVDNNRVERALKKAILHRKNSLFYKTENGAEVGDLFMSLIHTCELNGVNSFDYLTELLRHAERLKQNPSEWMPWNYRDTLAQLAIAAAA
jgi:transposase